jgi:hypothetical protein
MQATCTSTAAQPSRRLFSTSTTLPRLACTTVLRAPPSSPSQYYISSSRPSVEYARPRLLGCTCITHSRPSRPKASSAPSDLYHGSDICFSGSRQQLQQSPLVARGTKRRMVSATARDTVFRTTRIYVLPKRPCNPHPHHTASLFSIFTTHYPPLHSLHLPCRYDYDRWEKLTRR